MKKAAKREVPVTDSTGVQEWALVQDAAMLTGVSRSVIRGWIATGRLAVTEWHGGKSLVLLLDVFALREDRPARGRPIKKVKK